MGKEQNTREIIKARNEYQKKKVEAQKEINKAMMEEEDRKLDEMRRKKSNREYWGYPKGPEDREQKKEHELYVDNKISTNSLQMNRKTIGYKGALRKDWECNAVNL